MKVLIFGAKGYMGQYFLTLYPDAATPSLDIADSRAVADVLDTEKPDVVINCAGKRVVRMSTGVILTKRRLFIVMLSVLWCLSRNEASAICILCK